MNYPKPFELPLAILISLSTLTSLSARAAEAPSEKTNAAPAGAKGEGKKDESKKDEAKAATIPDAASKPVFTTNTVTIAGQAVTYIAEAGMLPSIKSDGATKASV